MSTLGMGRRGKKIESDEYSFWLGGLSKGLAEEKEQVYVEE